MGNRNNKKVTLFTVINKNEPKQILTVTCNKMDAVDYAYRFLRVKHYDHFTRWCELRELKPESDDAWAKYFVTCLSKEERSEYLIVKKVFTLNHIASIMRMFGGCLPMGCSFDTENEYIFLKQKIETQQVAAKLMKNNLKEKVEKLLKEETEKPEEPVQDGK